MPITLKSESPDEFLKRAGLTATGTAIDGALVPKDNLPTIDKGSIAALNQPKIQGTTEDCVEC